MKLEKDFNLLLNFLQRYHFQTWFSRFITSRFYKIDNIFIFPVLLKDINWNIRQFSYIVNKIKALFPLIFSAMKVKQLLFKNSFYPKRFHFQNNWFIKKKTLIFLNTRQYIDKRHEKWFCSFLSFQSFRCD